MAQVMTELPHKFERLILWFVLTMFSILCVFSYLQTELTTKYYLSEIANWTELCNLSSNSDFKYIKVLEFEKSKGFARIFCLYKDGSKNVELDLNKIKIWTVIKTTKLNAEGNLYWPIYL